MVRLADHLLTGREAERFLEKWMGRRWPPAWGWGFGKCSPCCPKSKSTAPTPNCAGNGCPLPLTMHATFANLGKCPQVDGVTVPLTFVGTDYNTPYPAWNWDGVFGISCGGHLSFTCSFGNPAFGGCSSTPGPFVYSIGLNMAGGACGSNCASGPSTCNPVNIYFAGVPVCTNPGQCLGCTKIGRAHV